MPTITRSRLARCAIQIDGRYVVRDEHTDDTGIVHAFDYMADPQMDVSARMTARAVKLANATIEATADVHLVR
jgi:hypothetical protein